MIAIFRRVPWVVALLLFVHVLFAGEGVADPAGQVRVEMFLSSACEHCQKAQAFMEKSAKTLSWLEVTSRYVDKDTRDLDVFYTRLRETSGNADFAVPALFFCQSRWVGFDTDATTGENLLKGLKFCHDRLLREGKVTPQTAQVLRQWAEASRLGSGMQPTQTLLPFVPALALVNAFVPCALFFLFAFMAMLIVAPSARLRYIAGLSAIFSLGVMQVMQRAWSAWFILHLRDYRGLTVLAGLLLLLSVWQAVRKPPLRPGVFVALSALIAALLSLYQQGCSFNPSLVFAQWLHAGGYSQGKALVWSLGYQLVYLLPLIILLALSGRILGWLSRIRATLDRSAILFLYALGVWLVACPQCLSVFSFSVITAILAILGGWWLQRRDRS